MRHKIAGNRLSRNSRLRWATVRDLAKATLVDQRICTTKARAKEARKLVEKLITLGKKGTLADKRRAFSILCDHKIVSELFNETAPRFKNRVGGYTRIIKLGPRRGDNAQLAFLELTEKKEIIISKPKTDKGSKIVDVKASATIVKPEKKIEKTDVKETQPKKETIKQDSKDAVTHQQDQTKAPTKPLAGIRKMFNRKVGGQ